MLDGALVVAKLTLSTQRASWFHQALYNMQFVETPHRLFTLAHALTNYVELYNTATFQDSSFVNILN